jgi:uncharacterized protein YbjQ (UPF0145 family)
MMANSNVKTPPPQEQQPYMTGTPPPGAGWTPVPDPTLLSTQLVEKATANLKELLQSEIRALREMIESRLNGNDKAIGLLQQMADKSPTIAVVDQRLTDTVCLMHSKFKEYDNRVEEMVEASKNGVDAAFAAQKEAINKSETGFTKQIDNIGGQMHMLQKTFDDKINDIKDRLNGLSGLQIGTATGISSKEESSKAMWVIIGIIGTIIVGGFPILMAFFNRGGP